jgi:hypothetical protein
MTKKQVWIAVGVAGAVLAFGYLATKREINATITEGEASVTYNAGSGGAAAAPTAQDDSHQRMLQLIEQSNAALQTDVTTDATTVQ